MDGAAYMHFPFQIHTSGGRSQKPSRGPSLVCTIPHKGKWLKCCIASVFCLLSHLIYIYIFIYKYIYQSSNPDPRDPLLPALPSIHRPIFCSSSWSHTLLALVCASYRSVSLRLLRSSCWVLSICPYSSVVLSSSTPCRSR